MGEKSYFYFRRRKLILTCFIVFNKTSICANLQNDTLRKENKIQIGLAIGYSYKSYFGSKDIYLSDSFILIHSTNGNGGYISVNYNNAPYTKKQTNGFFIGLPIVYKKFKPILFLAGLNYYNRSDVYEKSIEDLINSLPSNYASNSTFRTYEYITKFEYTYNNLELSARIGACVKKMSFYVGFDIPIIVAYKSHYIYFNPNQNNPQYFQEGNQKTIQTIEFPIWKSQLPLLYYPSIDINYLLNNNRIRIEPTIGIAFGMQNTKSYFLKAGFIIGFNNLIKNKK
jgi:hypothetical protein